MRRRLIALVALVVAACSPLAPSSCGRTAPIGQFGSYAPPHKILRLPDGDTVTVYRVKQWIFNDDNTAALQLEFQSGYPHSDTIAIQQQARHLWPVFVHYVEQTGLSRAILTATDLDMRGTRGVFAGSMRSFGIVVHRDTTGSWRTVDNSQSMPSAVPLGRDVGIFEASGEPLKLSPAQ